MGCKYYLFREREREWKDCILFHMGSFSSLAPGIYIIVELEYISPTIVQWCFRPFVFSWSSFSFFQLPFSSCMGTHTHRALSSRIYVLELMYYLHVVHTYIYSVLLLFNCCSKAFLECYTEEQRGQMEGHTIREHMYAIPWLRKYEEKDLSAIAVFSHSYTQLSEFTMCQCNLFYVFLCTFSHVILPPPPQQHKGAQSGTHISTFFHYRTLAKLLAHLNVQCGEDFGR